MRAALGLEPGDEVIYQVEGDRVVLAEGGLGEGKAFLWVLMITSARNRPWPGDVPLVQDYDAVGLPAPSTIRTTKIARIEATPPFCGAR